MPEIIRSAQALADLDGIYDCVAESSPQNADMLVREFQRRFELLAANPTIGRLRPELAELLRSWNLYRFVIFYFATDAGIEVVRVLHSSMDIRGNHFRPPPHDSK
jgi:toxin ParE1/3/4